MNEARPPAPASNASNASAQPVTIFIPGVSPERAPAQPGGGWRTTPEGARVRLDPGQISATPSVHGFMPDADDASPSSETSAFRITPDAPTTDSRVAAKARLDAEREERIRAKAAAAAEAELLRAERSLERAERFREFRHWLIHQSPLRLLPAWSSSFVVHGAVMLVLLWMTFSPKPEEPKVRLDSAFDTKADDEPLKILTDRSDAPLQEISAPAQESGPPTPTPNLATAPIVSETAAAASVSGPGLASPLSSLPATLAQDISGGGMIAGDSSRGAGDSGDALDQLAREILRHLNESKLTVAWLFDESESMKDDQQAIKSRFNKVADDIVNRLGEERSQSDALLHTVIGFGNDYHVLLEPTNNLDAIGTAIDKIGIDKTGVENTMQAVALTVKRNYESTHKGRKLLVVLVTDESGDDGQGVEGALEILQRTQTPLYVIGRQSLFGQPEAHVQYTDPQTKDVYFPTIRRGPETADLEILQHDGLHSRWDEQPSGFAPYELARLTKFSGGIYFILPSEEYMRSRPREKGYSFETLKEYIPDYESRREYLARRNGSELRRTLYQYIDESKRMGFVYRFPVEPAKLDQEARKAQREATQRLGRLKTMYASLKSLRGLRDRETDKRWQASYDLMFAQICTYQIKAFEYQCCLENLIKTHPAPSQSSTAEKVIQWEIGHNAQRHAPTDITDPKYKEAEALLRGVMNDHPHTPWADLAKDELDRGFGVNVFEYVHRPKYFERGNLVPKY